MLTQTGANCCLMFCRTSPIQPPVIYSCNWVTWFNSLKINRKPCFTELDIIWKLSRTQVSLSLKLIRYIVVMWNNRHVIVVFKIYGTLWIAFHAFMSPTPGALLGQTFGVGECVFLDHISFVSQRCLLEHRIHRKSLKTIDPWDRN